MAERQKKFENKIDELAKEYFKEVLQIPETKDRFKSDGYYAILHHCLDKTQFADENSALGYFANVDIKED